MRWSSSQNVGYDSATAGSRGSSIMIVTLASTGRDVKCTVRYSPAPRWSSLRGKNRPTAGISLIETSRRPAVVSIITTRRATRSRPAPRAAEPVPGPGSPLEDDLIATAPCEAVIPRGRPDRPPHAAKQFNVRVAIRREHERGEGLHGWASRSVSSS